MTDRFVILASLIGYALVASAVFLGVLVVIALVILAYESEQ